MFFSLSRDVICYLNVDKYNKLKFYKKNINNKDKNDLDSEDEKVVVSWVLFNLIVVGNDMDIFFGLKGYYILIVGMNLILGVVGILCIDLKLDIEDISLIEIIIV